MLLRQTMSQFAKATRFTDYACGFKESPDAAAITAILDDVELHLIASKHH